MIDQDLLNQIQDHMIEPRDGGQSWPSDLWTRDEVIQYVNQRQDRLVRNTHIILEETSIGVIPDTRRHPLPEDWIATVRVTWTGEDGLEKPLGRSDSWEADNGLIDWPSLTAIPKLYMDGDTPSLTIQIAPGSVDIGTLDVTYVSAPPHIDGDGTEFGLVDEVLPTVKYGAMADMLSKVGRANDPRAKYCEDRFKLGVEIAQSLLKGFK